MRWKRMFGLTDNKAEALAIDEAAGTPPPETIQAGPEPGDEPEVALIAPVIPAAPEPPGLDWWWSVSHHGHPAFYLRTLMPGDFAPGLLPAPRHVRLLVRGEGLPAKVTCGTCGEVPRSEDLDVVERSTGARGFLDAFRAGRAKWPAATKAETCWACSGQAPADATARLMETDVNVCASCAKHLDRRT